jgi:hypothetical protein
MTTKTVRRHLVAFFATPRLASAYRLAAKRNKLLARCATMHELGHAGVARKLVDRLGNFEVVVLSHADEDHFVLTDERLEPVVSAAFHLLFTEPTTHPDQVAHWMRATNIRAENRLHVIKVEDLKAPQLSQLLVRVCSALGRDDNRGSIIDAYLSGDTLFVRGPKHRLLHVPVRSVSALRDQSRAVMRNFEVDPDGSFIHWPELDVHLGWFQFLQAVDPEELRKAQQRSLGFNVRYGAAIRTVREASGILQSKVEGLTERQVRRIEHGECRATSAAINALAKAHGVDANTYMERLTEAMTRANRSEGAIPRIMGTEAWTMCPVDFASGALSSRRQATSDPDCSSQPKSTGRRALTPLTL